MNFLRWVDLSDSSSATSKIVRMACASWRDALLVGRSSSFGTVISTVSRLRCPEEKDTLSCSSSVRICAQCELTYRRDLERPILW